MKSKAYFFHKGNFCSLNHARLAAREAKPHFDATPIGFVHMNVKLAY